MRTRTVTVCLLGALCLVRALTVPGGGRSGAGPPEAFGGGRQGATGGRSSGGTDGSRVADGRVAALPFCGGRSPPCDRVRPPRDAWSAVVRRVVDGDTVILLVRGRSVRVRLIGADAPEIWSRHDCSGAEAARALRGLLPPGSVVRAAGDRDAVDRYGRRLLYLWTLGRRAHMRALTTRAASDTPTFVAAWLIRAGLARAMYVPPNARYAAAMRAAESAARRSRAGLWSACAGR